MVAFLLPVQFFVHVIFLTMQGFSHLSFPIQSFCILFFQFPSTILSELLTFLLFQTYWAWTTLHPISLPVFIIKDKGQTKLRNLNRDYKIANLEKNKITKHGCRLTADKNKITTIVNKKKRAWPSGWCSCHCGILWEGSDLYSLTTICSIITVLLNPSYKSTTIVILLVKSYMRVIV